MKTLLLVVPVAAMCAAGCEYKKSPAVLQPTAVADAAAPVAEPTKTVYPSNGPAVVAYVAEKYPEKLAAGVSREERIANMAFLRDRIIEVGKCGGLDLGWNLKRGGPEVSVDFITERLDGHVIGHDIGFDYDNAGTPLRLYWGSGDGPYFKEYPEVDCR
jgi:hypothetical protein